MRICDDEENWSGQGRRLMSEREDELARLVEDKIKNGRPMTKQEKRYWDLLRWRSMLPIRENVLPVIDYAEGQKKRGKSSKKRKQPADWKRDYPEEGWSAQRGS